jgi:exodeoxyribonuclease III
LLGSHLRVMRIATWNVNSVRARLPRVLEFLERAKPDVVCLQEIKCVDEQFPREMIEDAGYSIATFGQKTYNGVAILSKKRIEDVRRGIDDGVEDLEARVISATVEDVILVNAYVINGQEVGADRYHYKLEWLPRLARWIDSNFDRREKVVVLGDFNVTFDDRDVHDPDLWREKILCSTPEREALAHITGLDLKDAFRKFHEEGGHFTWWDFRTKGFERKLGLRIDHILMSPPAYEACTDVVIDLEARRGEKPSDHAPVIATL